MYQQDDNYSTNMLEDFKVFQQSSKGSSLYTRGMLRGPEGQFEYDAINDKLPAVSWIMPTSFQSEHPDYMPADGAAFVASKIDAIAANPDVWAKTLFILNYDENDGIFDHVAPPVRPETHRMSSWTVFRLAPDFESRAFSFHRGPPEVGCAATCSTIHLPFSFSRSSRACASRISAIGAGVLSAISTSALRLGDGRKERPPLPDTSGPLRLAEYESKFLPPPVLPTTSQKPPEQEKSRDGSNSSKKS